MLFGICFGMSIAISFQNYKDSLIIDLVPYIIMIMLCTTLFKSLYYKFTEMKKSNN